VETRTPRFGAGTKSARLGTAAATAPSPDLRYPPNTPALAMPDVHEQRDQRPTDRGKTMPYSKTTELPDSVRDNLPEHAQEIYKEAYNSAWEQYAEPEDRREDAGREETAHRVAWSAVKQSYAKDAEGRWRAQE
jgi:cation transport regulator